MSETDPESTTGPGLSARISVMATEFEYRSVITTGVLSKQMPSYTERPAAPVPARM